ncbi:uncharacterized protein LOC103723592 [Phoenix dactylifera]|uniref:Uncharacterized protein LOC103723592 n=1 Tax=Phoenix dactylifera TaxID=42345 RepID=A0A8B7D4C8_PHODC|nr:uncharacterized protein LOC103723592 [Phoenix dactylifera]
MEACSEKWEMAALASPRISFSHDLSPSSTAEARRLDASLSLDSTADDFDFNLSVHIPTDDRSLADELFSDGKLLPLPIKNPSTPSNPPALPPPPTIPYPKKSGSLREIMASSEDDSSVRRSPSSSQKSFWRFRRSSSLTCSGGSSRPGLLCPFALLRSKSTGSSPTPNPPRPDKQYKKTNHTGGGGGGINSSSSFLRSFSTDSSSRIYYYSSARRSCSHGVRISPILNVPAASGASFCHLFCSCGGKSMRRGSAVTCSP